MLRRLKRLLRIPEAPREQFRDPHLPGIWYINPGDISASRIPEGSISVKRLRAQLGDPSVTVDEILADCDFSRIQAGGTIDGRTIHTGK